MIPEEVLTLAEEMGMPIVHQNGQRVMGPPFGVTIKPPWGTEVFVAKLPRNCTEVDVCRVFSTVGRLYEMRMMMDFSGTNRGYCYVRYFTAEEAQTAITLLNGFEIIRNRCIGVMKSVDNCSLFIGNLPISFSREEVLQEVSRVAEGVLGVCLKQRYTGQRYCFVNFTDHRSASIARRNFLTEKFKLWNLYLPVDWAQPRNDYHT